MEGLLVFTLPVVYFGYVSIKYRNESRNEIICNILKSRSRARLENGYSFDKIFGSRKRNMILDISLKKKERGKDA